VVVASKNKMTIVSLKSIPNEIQQNILAYLPFNIRLNLLQQKYNLEFLIKKLVELPKNINSFYKLYHLTTLAEPILTELNKENMIDFRWVDIFCGCVNDYKYSLEMIKRKSSCYILEVQKDILNGIEIDYCLNHFINIIIYAFTNFHKIYEKDLPQWHAINEKKIFTAFLLILL
jgi:hypothetical protein